MWSLNLEKIATHCGGRTPIAPLAIETGTCRGNGARQLAKAFPRVITIELDRALHESARQRLASLPQVECLQGSSAEVLERILPSLTESSAFFFLDAHWSGDHTVNWPESSWQGYGLDTAHLGSPGTIPSGEQQCPLASELGAISEHFRGHALVLIDDMKNLPPTGPGRRDHSFAGENWSHLSRAQLREIVASRLMRLHELSDPEQWLLELRPL